LEKHIADAVADGALYVKLSVRDVLMSGGIPIVLHSNKLARRICRLIFEESFIIKTTKHHNLKIRWGQPVCVSNKKGLPWGITIPRTP